jgi:phosphatidylglycerol lysyltransferase
MEGEHFADQSRAPADALALVEQRAYEFGHTYDSYLASEPDREYYFGPQRRGVIGFRRWARQAYVVGGLLAQEEERDALLASFMNFANRERLRVSFFNLVRSDLEPFRRQGFQVTKIGEEPLVALADATWRGKDYEWLRRQENYCARQGLVLEEVAHDPHDPAYRDWLVPELEDVSREHLAGTLHRRELEFFEGRFHPLALGRRRLFVARRAGRVEAFLVCNPALAGAVWGIEMFRRRAEATRGVVPFAMLRIMRQLKAEGVDYVSLSQVPCMRCHLAQRGDSRWMRWLIWLWWRGLGGVFDVRGIYHFKSRFRPVYREMYVAARPAITPLTLWGFGATWGLTRVSPLRLARHAWQAWRKGDRRATLAEPEMGADRLIRDLRVGRRDAAGDAIVPASASRVEASPQPAAAASADAVPP